MHQRARRGTQRRGWRCPCRKIQGLLGSVYGQLAALCVALFGVLGALATFLFGRRFLGNGVAALAALVLLTSLAYLGQSIALLTDMVFTTLVAGAHFVFYLWYDRRRWAYLHG